MTRPDINFAVNMLSRHSNAHNKSHCLAAKRVLHYLKGTKILDSPNLWERPVALNQLATVMQTGAMMWEINAQHQASSSCWLEDQSASVAPSTCEAEINFIEEAAKQALSPRTTLRARSSSGQAYCTLQQQPECPCCHQESWRRKAQMDQAH